MMPRLAVRTLRSTGAVIAAVAVSAPAASARTGTLDWEPCGERTECAVASVPRDYGNPDGPRFRLSVARRPATDASRRVGSLFINFGGPGAAGAQILRDFPPDAFAEVNDRFDLVSWDPRGTGDSSGALDCDVPFDDDAAPFLPTPLDPALEQATVVDTHTYIARCLERDPGGLAYIATTNTVRDLDRLRATVGDERLTYLGYSYGTLIGAQYATLFPGRARTLVLDGAVNVEGFVRRPIEDYREFAAGFERSLSRFFQACAAYQDVCGFGGADPWDAYDQLVERLNAEPIPAPALGGRPVNGDDVLVASVGPMFSKYAWPVLAQALAAAEAGDGSLIQQLADPVIEDDGTITPFGDWFTAINSLDARWPRPNVERYLEAGRHAWRLFDHFWWISGYADLVYGEWPIRPRGAYYGPVENPAGAPTALVIGTTYDPATPYRNVRLLVRDLGNARLLTMRGDGHTAAFQGNSPCIDTAVEAYLEDGTLPPERTVCVQEVPFEPPAEARRLAPPPYLPVPRPVGAR